MFFRLASRALLVLVLSSLAAPARAAGFYYPDLGAKALGRGATGAAGTGDLAAMALNPAGLAELEGLRLQIELSAAQQPVTFTRKGPCGGLSATCPSVANGSGTFLNAVAGVSYKLGGLVLAAGAYGPPSVGRYEYPDPRSVKDNVALAAPQRYSLIASDNFILYPGLAAAYRAASWLDVGAVAQVRTFHVHQSQSIFVLGGIGGDIPEADAVATFDARDKARLVVGAGLIARPAEGISIGLSARPAAPVNAEGTLDVDAPLASVAGVRVEGRAAKVELTLPAEARLGVRYTRPTWLLELDGIWEGWGVLREITVTPLDVVLKSGQGAGETSTRVDPIHLDKRFRGAFSVRLGGEVDVPAAWLPAALGLRLRAGALYETSAIPDETLQIDFPNGARAAGTVGATLRVSELEATVAYAHFFETTAAVSQSVATRINPYPAPAFIIGNGRTTSSLDALALQVAWTFGR